MKTNKKTFIVTPSISNVESLPSVKTFVNAHKAIILSSSQLPKELKELSYMDLITKDLKSSNLLIVELGDNNTYLARCSTIEESSKEFVDRGIRYKANDEKVFAGVSAVVQGHLI